MNNMIRIFDEYISNFVMCLGYLVSDVKLKKRGELAPTPTEATGNTPNSAKESINDYPIPSKSHYEHSSYPAFLPPFRSPSKHIQMSTNDLLFITFKKDFLTRVLLVPS